MANGGLVTSFLDAFQGLQQMEHQKRQDERQAAEMEVDKVLRQQEIKLREQGLRQQDERASDDRALRQQVEERRAGDAQTRFAQRESGLHLAQDKFDYSKQRIPAEQLRNIVNKSEELFRTLVTNGVDAETARLHAEQHKAELAAQVGLDLSQMQQPQAPAGGQGPLTLSGQFGQQGGMAPSLGVLPKVASSMAALKAGDDLKAAQKTLTNARTDLVQQTIADRVSEKAVKDEFLKNRNLIQEERLKLMPLEATAKRLGLQTEKLRQQKLQGEIDMQPISRAIKQLEMSKAQNTPKWSEDAKYMRQWLDKEYVSAQKSTTNALSHLSQLREKQRKSDEQISYIEGLKKNGKATPEDFASLDAIRAARMDRQASINFYSGEYDTALKMRNGFKGQMDGLLGITTVPVTDKGTVDSKALRSSRGLPSLGPAPVGGNLRVKVRTPAEARALKPGTPYETPDGQRFVR